MANDGRIFYGQTPGYTFGDWRKISPQQWSDPSFWSGQGQQQWGPQPLSMPTGGADQGFMTNQRNTWADWMKNTGVSGSLPGMDFLSPQPGTWDYWQDQAFQGYGQTPRSGTMYVDPNPFPDPGNLGPFLPETPASNDYNIDPIEFIRELVNAFPAGNNSYQDQSGSQSGGHNSASESNTDIDETVRSHGETDVTGWQNTDTTSYDREYMNEVIDAIKSGDESALEKVFAESQQRNSGWESMIENIRNIGAQQTQNVGQQINTNDMLSKLTDPQARQAVSALISQMQGLSPMYGQSLRDLSGLPGDVDNWTNDLISGFRTRNDDIVNAMSQVANDRANRNIMAGTETENLRAKTMAELANTENLQRNQALSNALGLKATAAMQTPAVMGQSFDNMLSAIGLTDRGQESLGVTDTASVQLTESEQITRQNANKRFSEMTKAEQESMTKNIRDWEEKSTQDKTAISRAFGFENIMTDEEKKIVEDSITRSDKDIDTSASDSGNTWGGTSGYVDAYNIENDPQGWLPLLLGVMSFLPAL